MRENARAAAFDVFAGVADGAMEPFASRRFEVTLPSGRWLEVDFDAFPSVPLIIKVGVRAPKAEMRSGNFALPEMLIRPHAGNVASLRFGDLGSSDTNNVTWSSRVLEVASDGKKSPVVADRFAVKVHGADEVDLELHPWNDVVPRIQIASRRFDKPAPGVMFKSLSMTLHLQAANLVSFHFTMERGFTLTPEVAQKMIARHERVAKWLRRLSFGILGKSRRGDVPRRPLDPDAI